MEETAPDTAPAMKESMNVEAWLLLFRDWERGRVCEVGGSRMSVNEFLTDS